MKTPLHCFLLLRIRKVYHAFFFLTLLTIIHSSVLAQTVTTGKSYINITRPNGGTFLPGDIIEVRATIAVTGGNATNRVNQIRYNDTINLAKLSYITGSLQMLSNEGRLQVQYTDGADADSANISLASGRLRFNIGNQAGSADVNSQGTSITNAGRLWGSLRPTFYGGTCIRVFSYRAQIRSITTIVDIDTILRLSAGNFRYTIGTTDYVSTFPIYQVKIAPDYGLCTNSIGANAILGENAGTFGSGPTQNRAGGTPFVPLPYTQQNFSTNTPNDNYYGLANRTSADGSNNPNIAYPNASRVFNVWDIIGDHTGATNPLLGNPPTNAGYAVIINASYETNRAFSQLITNVCEDTYYEFSAWFRNICRRCGCDSSGKGAMMAGYIPAPGNDSSGVRPNLTFQIDGQDVYTSGNIPYSGQWVKKGFLFKTRTGQTSFVVTIRNNAPGGGGNDWAIDDIGVATCLPNMKYSPSNTPNICAGGVLKIEDTVRSYFNNYVYYRWQRSADGGNTWTNVSTVSGPVSPVWKGSYWEYVSTYHIPAAMTQLANLNDRYRLVTATSTTNLTDLNCLYTDKTNIITLNVLNCQPPLNTRMITFTGNLQGQLAHLRWTTANEDEPLRFEIERSEDGVNYRSIGWIDNEYGHSAEQNNYTYIDAEPVRLKSFYRIVIRADATRFIYSRILPLSVQPKTFAFVSVVNPFSNELLFDISTDRAGLANVELIDHMGNGLKSKSFDLREGINQLTFDNTGQLRPGLYVLRVELNGYFIFKRVLKQ